MIFYDRKLIFVHLPRTAGSLIEKSITNTYTGNFLNPKHFEAYDYKTVYPEEWESFYKFAWVRNPFDWCVSLAVRFDCPLDTLLGEFESRPNIWQAFRSAPRWSQKLPMSNAIDGVDFVGKFETLESDYKILQDKFDLPDLLINEQFKKTEGRDLDYKSYYTDYEDQHRIEAIERIFEKDLQNFGYTFENGIVREKFERRMEQGSDV
tara:strand:- start:4370 stop:4990 length:621 start_codon:yes stop_codon:yes gene_type:complete